MNEEVLTKAAQLDPSAIRESDHSAAVVFATRDRDREGDELEISGIDFGPYSQNSVVLRDHDHRAVVGSSRDPRTGKLSLRVGRDEVEARCFFTMKSAASVQCWDEIRSGALRAASIGFLSREAEPMSKGARRPARILRSEMLEWSWTSVPMNSRAVIGTPCTNCVAYEKAFGGCGCDDCAAQRRAATIAKIRAGCEQLMIQSMSAQAILTGMAADRLAARVTAAKATRERIAKGRYR